MSIVACSDGLSGDGEAVDGEEGDPTDEPPPDPLDLPDPSDPADSLGAIRMPKGIEEACAVKLPTTHKVMNKSREAVRLFMWDALGDREGEISRV